MQTFHILVKHAAYFTFWSYISLHIFYPNSDLPASPSDLPASPSSPPAYPSSPPGLYIPYQDSYRAPHAPIITQDTNEEVFYLSNDETYSNALHVIPMVTGDITEPDGDGLSPLPPVIKYIKYTTNEDNTDVKNDQEAISDNIGQSKADDHRTSTWKS